MFSIFYQPLVDKTDPRLFLNEEISIYDCLEIFSKKKKLKEEKNYICPQCNKKVIPSQIKIPYISPQYFIVSFNRIEKDFDNLADYLNNKKNETPIWYPIDNFDLNPFFIGNNNLNNNKSLYNLIAVVLHIGDIKKGNYKTLIRKKQLWYEIKNQDIKQINSNEIINNNAYILIYEKKNYSFDLNKNLEDEKNIDIDIDIDNNDITIKNEIKNNNINYDNSQYFDENIPLKKGKKNKKIFGEMKDI